jgi:hypothetical protein
LNQRLTGKVRLVTAEIWLAGYEEPVARGLAAGVDGLWVVGGGFWRLGLGEVPPFFGFAS